MKTGVAATRTVVSGVGVVSPIGIGHRAFWESLSQGRSGVENLRPHLAGLPVRVGAEVKEFDPVSMLPQKKFLKVMSRDIQLGVAAARLAMKDAGLKKGMIPPDRLGVVFGAGRMSPQPCELADSVARQKNFDFDANRWSARDMEKIAPLWLLRQLPNMPAAHVSIAFDAKGPNNTITNRDASTLFALAEAVNMIERAAVDCVIVGGCGSLLQPVDQLKLMLSETVSKSDAEPATISKPFDRDRDGMVLGEGAAAFIVERLSHVEHRQSTGYAEVVGLGYGCDVNKASCPSGTGLAHAMRAALMQSNLEARQIGHLNAQGNSTPEDDLIESQAYHRALGDVANSIPVTALKSFFGFCDAGSGAMELAGSLLALRHEQIPFTLNSRTPDVNCGLNVVRDSFAQPHAPTAMCLNRTEMGQSIAVVLRTI